MQVEHFFDEVHSLRDLCSKILPQVNLENLV